jgi:CheY-like chemotaxis protein
MCVLDGPATLVALQEKTPQIPCCFMSGELGHYTEERLRRFGARAVFKKPFQLRDLARLLRDVATNNDAEAAPGALQVAGPTNKRMRRALG